MSHHNRYTRQTQLIESNRAVTEYQNAMIVELQENLDLLSQELHKTQWLELSATGNDLDFKLPDRKTIAKQAQYYFIKNPLIGLAVTLKTAFVFGKGISVKAEHALIQDVIDDFWDDPDNKTELTGKQAQKMKSNTFQLDGNIFLTLFVNISDGKVKVSSIPIEEVDEIIMHPDNRRKPLWYKRVYQDQKFDYSSGAYSPVENKTVYYRDWKNTDSKDRVFDPPADKIAKDGAGQEILVFHFKTNCTDKQKFGFSETYRAHDWAKAYTDFLSNLASIWKSLSIFAWERKLQNGTKGQIAAAKAQMRTYAEDGERINKQVASGSTRVSNQSDNLAPIKTNGVTMQADDGRRLLLMVCAAMGIFEHYFGDGSNSNLASTESMELPMLKMFEDRQSLWEDVFRDLFTFIIHQSAKASSGKLHKYAYWEDQDNQTGKLTLDGYVNPVQESAKIKEAARDGQPDPVVADQDTEISQTVSVDFPPITVKDVAKIISSLKTALTLDGNGMSQTPMITPKAAAKMVMTALDMDNVDDTLNELYPDEGQPEPGTNNNGPNAEDNYLAQLNANLENIKNGNLPAKPNTTGLTTKQA